MIWTVASASPRWPLARERRPTGTSHVRSPSSTASTSASRRSGVSTATRSRRRSRSATSSVRSPSLARFEERAARSQIPWSLAVSARCRGPSSPRTETWRAPPVRWSVRSPSTSAARCRSSGARTLLVHGQVQRRLKQKRQARAVPRGGTGELPPPRRRAVGSPDGERARAGRRSAGTRRAERDRALDRAAGRRRARRTRRSRRRSSSTRKAVEANLARAYRKLGIRSRAQLARALDARESEARSVGGGG